MQSFARAALAAAFVAGSPAALAQTCDIDGLRYDQTQVIGTHNSYKIEGDDGIDHAMRVLKYAENAQNDAREIAYRLAYHHPPLDVQLDIGVRALEIDVHDDPEGGLFASPGGYRALAKVGLEPNAPYDPHGLMRAPGFKVLHVPDWDVLSNCPTLTVCLATLADWSDRHPGHFPVMIRVEAKEKSFEAVGDTYAPVKVRRFDRSAFERLQSQIEAGIGPGRVYTRAAYAGQWPQVRALRGKFIFVLSGEPDVGARYQAAMGERPRLFFTLTEPGGAVPVLNLGEAPVQAKAEASGSVLYTRSETTETREARENDPAPRERAFRGAGNIIWSDYAIPDARFSDYRVRFKDGVEGGFVRPHPLRAPAACRATRGGR